MNKLNLQSQIKSQQQVVIGIKCAIEELEEAMRHYAMKSQIVWSTLWEKSWELSKELEKEQRRLHCLTKTASRPNRDQRRGALVAAMQVGDRIILE